MQPRTTAAQKPEIGKLAARNSIELSISDTALLYRVDSDCPQRLSRSFPIQSLPEAHLTFNRVTPEPSTNTACTANATFNYLVQVHV
jgi:hypothetical protein